MALGFVLGCLGCISEVVYSTEQRSCHIVLLVSLPGCLLCSLCQSSEPAHKATLILLALVILITLIACAASVHITFEIVLLGHVIPPRVIRYTIPTIIHENGWLTSELSVVGCRFYCVLRTAYCVK